MKESGLMVKPLTAAELNKVLERQEDVFELPNDGVQQF